jgi:exoribonuclease R
VSQHASCPVLTQLCSQSFGDAFLRTGGREGPKEGERNKLPVGEVVHVYPRNQDLHLCGLVNRRGNGWGDRRACLSSKAVYSQDPRHQASFASGLPDFVELTTKYGEKDDGFVITRLIRWDADQRWPSVQVVSALCQLPLERQMFICLAVSHGLRVPDPAAHPSEMFPFERSLLKESSEASRTAVAVTRGRIDMRAAAVFTIDADVTVDLDDAMHCRKLDDGNYEVCLFDFCHHSCP